MSTDELKTWVPSLQETDTEGISKFFYQLLQIFADSPARSTMAANLLPREHFLRRYWAVFLAVDNFDRYVMGLESHYEQMGLLGLVERAKWNSVQVVIDMHRLHQLGSLTELARQECVLRVVSRPNEEKLI